MHKILLGLASGLLIAAPAFAEPVNYKAAKKLLFPAKKTTYQLLTQDFLSAADVETIKLMATLDAPEYRLVYYAAIAVSPDAGLMATASQASKGHHNINAAETAAKAACDALRKGDAPCVIVARILPDGWEPRALQLSEPATVAVAKDYRRGRKPKAMAISPSTGEFSVAKGEAAASVALIECNTKASQKGASDCEIVIADP